MDRLQCKFIGLHPMVVEIGGQLMLSLSTTGKELDRTVTMGSYTFSTPDKWLDIWILKNLMEFGREKSRRHRSNLLVEKRFSLSHQTS